MELESGHVGRDKQALVWRRFKIQKCEFKHYQTG